MLLIFLVREKLEMIFEALATVQRSVSSGEGKKKATFKSQEKSTESRIRCGCFPGSIAKNLL